MTMLPTHAGPHAGGGVGAGVGVGVGAGVGGTGVGGGIGAHSLVKQLPAPASWHGLSTPPGQGTAPAAGGHVTVEELFPQKH